jgi:hypothetical protein
LEVGGGSLEGSFVSCGINLKIILINRTWENIAIVFFILMLLNSFAAFMAIGSGHNIPKDTRRVFYIVESILIIGVISAVFAAWKFRRK